MEHNQNTHNQKKELVLLDIGQKSPFCHAIKGRPFRSKWFQWAFRYAELLRKDDVFLLSAQVYCVHKRLILIFRKMLG